MKCVHCTQEITEDNRFCPFCGKEQVSKCPSCGKDAGPGTAFCVHCGARLGASGTVAASSSAAPQAPPVVIKQADGNPNAVGGPPSDHSAGSGGTLYYPSQSISNQPYAGQTETGQVQSDVFVGVGRRFVAILVDTIILYIFNYFIARTFGGTATTDMTGGMSSGFNLQGPAALIVMIADLAYFVVMEGMLGATVGKLMLGIRVVMADGSKAGVGASLVRNLLRIVDGIPFLIPYLLGAILVWTSQTKQRIGDRAAKTVVVKASALK